LSKADKAYLNCVFEERDDGKFYIPTMFIKGHFDNDMNFISNPAYILDQPNSLELMQQYSKEIDNRFLKRASNPKIEQQLVDDKIKNSIENELRKQGYNKDEIFLVMRSKQETSDERILTARNESVKLSEKYSNEFTNANDVLPKNKLTIDLNNIKTVGKLELSSVINMTSELMKDMLGQSLNTPSINTQIKKQ